MAFGRNDLHKGHLYKSHLGSSLSDLSSRLERQRPYLPKQYEKFSIQVATDQRSRHVRDLPVLNGRTPVIVERRAPSDQTSNSGSQTSQGTEICTKVLDTTFTQHSKPGARPPWKPNCFCPRCGYMRQRWVEQNRKPFRPFSRQRELTFILLTGSQVVNQQSSLPQQESTQHQEEAPSNHPQKSLPQWESTQHRQGAPPNHSQTSLLQWESTQYHQGAPPHDPQPSLPMSGSKSGIRFP